MSIFQKHFSELREADYHDDVIRLVSAVIFCVGLCLASVPCPGQDAAPALRLPATVRPVRYSADLRARLELILGKGIDPRELQYTRFNALPQTREIVWEFVQQNLDAINSTIAGARGIPFGALLPLTAAGFCDNAHRQQVENFFQPRMATLPGGARYLANTLERIRLCSARAAVIMPAIVDLLKK